MAFESLPGVKITDLTANRAYIVADFFSVYENAFDAPGEIPLIYKWSDFSVISETRDAFILEGGSSSSKTPNAASGKVFRIPKDIIPDVASQIRIRAILEGVIASNPRIEYRHGRRILPPKTVCVGCEIPPEAYIATGGYRENEINNSNVILKNSGFDKLMWGFIPIATIAAFIAQALFIGELRENILQFTVVSVFTGIAAGLSIYLFCVYSAKTLYAKILREDPAVLEEITFVVCEEGLMAAESEVYDFSDIIKWHEVDYFIETDKVFIIFFNTKAVFWLPKRLFPKELHKELGDFIAEKLQGTKEPDKSEKK
jgi:hypothetical protein